MASDPSRRAVMRRPALVLAAALVGLAAAGCDKCGNRVHFNVPEVQKACADDTPR